MKQLLFLVLISGLLSCRPNGNHIDINNNDLFYTPAIDKAFIAKASEYLVSTDFFSQGGKSVQLDIVNATPFFRIVIKEAIANDSNTRATAIAFGRIIQKDLYDNKPYALHLCNRNFKTLRAFKFN